jgi:hypothetical protein
MFTYVRVIARFRARSYTKDCLKKFCGAPALDLVVVQLVIAVEV